jgi:hypothetical protein
MLGPSFKKGLHILGIPLACYELFSLQIFFKKKGMILKHHKPP